jgi:hypothetical protein
MFNPSTYKEKSLSSFDVLKNTAIRPRHNDTACNPNYLGGRDRIIMV